MKNENRAVFDRTSEPFDMPFEMPHSPSGGGDADGLAKPRSSRSPIGRLALHTVTRLCEAAILRWRRRRNRLALLELSDEQLKDIGISRSVAYGDVSQYRRGNSHDLERKAQ